MLESRQNALEELKLFADKITVSNDESVAADVIYNDNLACCEDR